MALVVLRIIGDRTARQKRYNKGDHFYIAVSTKDRLTVGRTLKLDVLCGSGYKDFYFAEVVDNRYKRAVSEDDIYHHSVLATPFKLLISHSAKVLYLSHRTYLKRQIENKNLTGFMFGVFRRVTSNLVGYLPHNRLPK